MSYYSELWDVKEMEGAILHYHRFWNNFKGKILDVGCSIGNFVAQDPENITGIDIDKEAIEIARKRGLKCLLMNFLNNRFKDKSFEGINAYAFIEHFYNPLEIMIEFKRLLKPNGRLVIVTHSIRSVCNTQSNYYDDYTHCKIYTKHSLKQLALDSGFKIIGIDDMLPNVKGCGWLMRRGVPIRKIISLKKFLKHFFISNDLYLIAESVG